jgi:hypothetical protein
MNEEASYTRAVLKTGDAQLIRSNRDKTAKRNRQCMAVKERDAEQRRCEQDKVEWHSEKENWFGQFGLKRV